MTLPAQLIAAPVARVPGSAATLQIFNLNYIINYGKSTSSPFNVERPRRWSSLQRVEWKPDHAFRACICQ